MLFVVKGLKLGLGVWVWGVTVSITQHCLIVLLVLGARRDSLYFPDSKRESVKERMGDNIFSGMLAI